MATPAAPTYGFAENQQRAKQEAQKMQDGERHKSYGTLVVQDLPPLPNEVIYVYNLLERTHEINQPPLFPVFRIPACEPGKKFAVTTLPRYVNEVREDFLRDEKSYKTIDGRRAATSLLNPDIFPGTDWSAQLAEGRTGNGDQTGNNLNSFGVFWSLTKPDDPALEKQIALFRKRAEKTLRGMIDEGNRLNANEKERHLITPLMHFAMEYFHLQAPWHMSHERLVPCPNCGERIREGIAYHKNEFGERCIIDMERYNASIAAMPAGDTASAATALHRSPRRLESMSQEEINDIAKNAGGPPEKREKKRQMTTGTPRRQP
jgi:hypothetical protein